MIEVAVGSSYADEHALVHLAERCAEINDSLDYARDITKIICAHDNATDKVIATLSTSCYYRILELAANSPYAGETTLTCLAERCIGISDSRDYARDIAKNICNNPHANDNVIAILSGAHYYKVLDVAAGSPYAGETALTHLAERCAEINDSLDYAKTIAKTICSNPNATATALQPLAKSGYGAVVEIGHDAIDALTP